MGLISTIKGWFNIGGVKVKIEGLSQVVPKTGNKITAKVTLTTKTDKSVTKLKYKFLMKRTTGSGNEKKTKDVVIAERAVAEPFELKAGESKTFDFDLDYTLEKGLKDQGGVMGGIGKLAAFASGEKDEYFVVAEADVKGAAFSTSDSVALTVK